VLNKLRQVGLEVTRRQVDAAQWHPMIARKDDQVGANVTGNGVDDPDANLHENYACGSPRNYRGYCSEDVTKLLDAQSRRPIRRSAGRWWPGSSSDWKRTPRGQ
jgi:peptide/nickel transport system substrate-binding protein